MLASLAPVLLLALYLLPASSAAATTAARTIAIFGDTRNSGSASGPSTGFLKIEKILGGMSFHASIALGDYADLSGDATSDRAKDLGFLSAAAPLIDKGRVVWLPGNHERLTDADDHLLWHDLFWHEAVPTGDPTQDQRHHWGPFKLAVGTKTLRGFMLSSVEGGVASGTIGFKTATYSSGTDSAWMTQSRQARELVTWLKGLPRTAYVVVAIHHPLFDTKNGEGYSIHTTERDALAKLFARSGVDLVLQADVHFYRRHMGPGGVVYLNQSMGGADPRPAAYASSATEIPRLDSHDVSSLGSPSGGADRFGFTIIRQTTGGALKARTFFVSNQQETVRGTTYGAGARILWDTFTVPRIAKR